MTKKRKVPEEIVQEHKENKEKIRAKYAWIMDRNNYAVQKLFFDMMHSKTTEDHYLDKKHEDIGWTDFVNIRSLYNIEKYE